MQKSRKILIIAQQNSLIDNEVKYGASWATIEIAKYLSTQEKYQIYIAAISSHHVLPTTEEKENIRYLLAKNEKELRKYINLKIKIVDTLIQISRIDYTTIIKADKYIIYNHNPSKIYFTRINSAGIINFFKIPVVCVSKFSCDQQISYGINNSLLKIIPNGYNTFVFNYNHKDSIYRSPYSIIFAGTIVDYKGVDIALKAFIKIKKDFPEAIFKICGSNKSWKNTDNHDFEIDWLDKDGFPIWSKIESNITGVKYLGELSQSELAEEFRQTSILITPSRIGETFGLVSLESQACGCIPILPNQGGFPETLKNGITGYLYEKNTPNAIADTIITLWKKGLPTVEQRLAAQTWTQETFSWDKAGSDFVELIENTPKNQLSFLLNDFLCLTLAFWKSLKAKLKIFFYP
jgi:glycosyltransferase involved in cell wall biosynthesis